MSTSGYNTRSASGKQSTATPMTHLFKGLENLWNTRAQADIIVNIQGKKISCHKVVLMAASSYFEAMFNSGMQEAISGEINFKDMDANTFELVLEYIYTGKDGIVTIENGFALFEAASLLQIEQLFKKCEYVLSQNIALDNCLDTWRFASVHNSDQRRFGAFEVILSQFEEFVKRDGFMTLKFDELYKIIQHDRLNVPTEEFLLKVVLEWGNDCADNKAKLGKLCSNLRLCQLSGEHLMSLKEYFSTTIDSELARKTIDKALQYKLIPARRQATNSIIVGYRDCNPVEDVLVAVGGIKGTSVGEESIREVIAFSSKKSKWFQLAPLPHTCGSFFAIGSNHENIYITGGTIHEIGHLQYRATSNSWELGTALRQGRYAHAMATMSESLYVFGGCTGKGDETKVLSSIEKYSFGAKTWSYCGDLARAVAWPSSTITDTKVFLFGGVKKQDVESMRSPYYGSNLVQYLDIFTNAVCQITLPCSSVVNGAIQLDNHTYLCDELGWISQFNALEETLDIIGPGKIFCQDQRRYYSLLHMDDRIYVTFGLWDNTYHLIKQITVFDSETWDECRPLLLPYSRSIEGCVRITIEKKFLTKAIKCRY